MSENYCVSLKAGGVLFGCVVEGATDGEAISKALKATQSGPFTAIGTMVATKEMMAAKEQAEGPKPKPDEAVRGEASEKPAVTVNKEGDTNERVHVVPAPKSEETPKEEASTAKEGV